MRFTIGIDTGGTFTDCVVVAQDGQVYYDKALTTPPDFATGVLNSVENGATSVGLSAVDLLAKTDVFGHGTTVATNRLFTRTGVKTGLITTAGHEDAILIGRVYQKVAGLVEREITNAVKLDKPEPIVPRPLIRGVTERVDYKGEILVALDRQEVVEAIDSLVEQGVEAVAISLLWSFMNPQHEREIKALIRERYPDLFVTISSELAPILGEYERTATCVMNSYLGSTVRDYLLSLDGQLCQKGLSTPCFVMQSTGGVVPVGEAGEGAVYLLSSGPAGGVIGAQTMARLLGYDNVVTTDVGGTSFDVGLIAGGAIQLAREPVFEQYHVVIPVVDVTSIGAGGGSIARVDPETRLLRVGPQSAGASPGPVCYGLGGVEPTVTDADVVLGRIEPGYFFGGRMRISRETAEAAIQERIAGPLGVTPVEAAKAIVDIVDARMADLVRKVSIERGYDPRDFVLFSYGGSGPTHVGAYAADVGVRNALISPYAPVFSAFGIAGSDMVRTYVRSQPTVMPIAADKLNEIFQTLETRALEDLHTTGTESKGFTLTRTVEMRFRQQTNQLSISIPTRDLTEEDIFDIVNHFTQSYEHIFGPGTAYAKAGIEMATFRVSATVKLTRVALRRHELGPSDASGAIKGERPVYFENRFVPTRIYDAQRLGAGNKVPGPAVVESPATTLVLHPNQRVHVDEYLNLLIDFD